MKVQELHNIMLNLCHNATHSAKISDILEVTGATKKMLWVALQQAPFKWRIGENLNGVKLLIIHQ